MSHPYLVQIAFTAETVANLNKTKENRFAAITPVVERLGGSFVGSWLSFGEYDSTAIIMFPDNVCAKSFEMTCYAGGGLRKFNMTPLMSFEDGIEAMHKTDTCKYPTP